MIAREKKQPKFIAAAPPSPRCNLRPFTDQTGFTRVAPDAAQARTGGGQALRENLSGLVFI